MAQTADQTLCKQPAEVRKFTMDFTNVLATSETLSGISSVASEKVGGYTSDLGITNTALVGTTGVSMVISSGTTGSRYRIEVLVTTSTSQTLEGDGILFVSDV